MSSSAGSGVSNTRKLLSASALMAAGTLVSRGLGILRTMLVAFILGNGTRQADILSLASTISNGMYILFVGGAVNTVLVPQIVRAIRHDEDGGEAFTNRIMTAFMLAISVVTVVLTLLAPLITFLYSSDAYRTPDLESQYASMVALTYCTLPQIFFYGAYTMLGQILNARDQFGPMMWAPIANNVISILVLGFYLMIWGAGGDHSGAFTTEQILLLGIGSTLGIAAQALVLIPFVKKIGFRFRPRFDLRGAGLGKTFQLAKWTLGFVLINQAVLMLVNRLATSATAAGSGGGSNVYGNASLIWMMPHSLITVSLATAMLPNASRLAAEGDLEGVAAEARKTMRLSLVALVPASMVFLALSDPMAILLFGHGQGSRDANLIAWALGAFALGTVPFTVQFICLRTFYALEDTRTPFRLQLVIGGVNAVGALLLVHLINDPSWTAAALAGAYSLAYLVGVQLSWRQLKRKIPHLNGRDLMMHVARLGIGAGSGALVAWFLSNLILDALPGGILGPLLALCLGGGIIGAGFLVVGKALKVRELASLGDMIRSRLGRGTPSAPTEDEKPQKEPSLPHIPTIGAEPATAAALVDDLMPTGLHTIIADGTFNGWNAARIPEESMAAALELPSLVGKLTPDPADVDPDSTDDLVATRITPVVQNTPAPEPSVSPVETSMQAQIIGPDEPSMFEGVDEITSGQRLMSTGDLLSTRFRIEELITVRDGIETWRSHDLVLSRDVMAHIIPEGSPHTTNLLQAARKGAIATDSRFLRVLDAVSLDNDPREIGGYIVCEYAHGSSLANLLKHGPLSTLEAAWVVRELADALTSLHGQGLFHEQLTPNNIVITTLGAVKLAGFGVEAGFHPNTSVKWSDREAADVRGLASLLYAMLVLHWPGGDMLGLPAAPLVNGEIALMSSVTPGISPALDRICAAALAGQELAPDQRITTASQLASELATVLGTADASPDLEARVRQPQNPIPTHLRPTPLDSMPTPVVPDSTATQVQPAVARQSRQRVVETSAVEEVKSAKPTYEGRPLLWVVLVAAIATLVISLIVVAINSIGRPEAPGSSSPTPTASESQEAPATGTVIPVATVTDFDPRADNGNGQEHPDQVNNAIDGDPSTGWSTMQYLDNPKLGGLKPGVGLVLDLGKPVKLGEIEVTFAAAGETVELRVPEKEATDKAPMDRQAQWRTVATAEDTSEQTVLTPTEEVTSRYVLIYLTKLPEVSSGRYVGTVNEIVVKQG